MNILETIADYARFRVAEDKRKLPLEEIKQAAERMAKPAKSFKEALVKPELSFICEIKKASPSKGIISRDFPYKDIAHAYDAAGADAISCLTEPKWFYGSDEIFKEVRALTEIPIIRKDFVVDEYQIYQARILGANAVLLICAILNGETLERYLEICERLGLDALVEAHDEDEIRKAKAAGAKLIGVNNRNLKDFSVDFENAKRLRDLIPDDAVYVAESGVSCPDDVKILASIGADAALVGEYLMRSKDKEKALAKLREAAREAR